MKQVLFLLFLIFFLPLVTKGQVEDDRIKKALREQGIPEDQFQEELERRGMNEEDFKEQVKEQGVVPPPVFNEEGDPATQKREQSVEEKVVKNPVKKDSTIVEPRPVQRKDSKIYGHHIFRNKSLSLFEPSGKFKASPDYIIGEGDEFSISIWGDITYSKNLRVNKEGYIQDQYIPRIYVQGMKLDKAEAAIKSNIGNAYNLRNSFLEIVLTYSRPITIGIYGDVFDPGSYSISALNTALNALVAAGGPNEKGSVRKIKIMRPGQKDILIDVYKYLKNPSNQDNIYLKDNDVIYVPTIQKITQIEGGIMRPHKYELLENEGIVELMDYAGGFTPDAYKGNVQIKRYENDRELLIDFNYTELQGNRENFKLQNGDRVTVLKIKDSFQNYVEASGAVEQDGKFELEKGMRLFDVINKSGLREDAMIDQIYILRKQEDLTNRYIAVNLEEVLKNRASSENILLKPRDKVIVSSKADFIDDFTVSISGEVRKPGKIEYDEKVTVDALLHFAGGVKPTASEIGLIKRTEVDETVSYRRVNLTAVIEDPSSPENIVLAPMDELIVYPKARFTDSLGVEIFGAVRVAGDYSFSPNMTLNDLIFLAGGLRKEAANSKIEISRVITENVEETIVVVARATVDKDLVLKDKGDWVLEPFDQVFVRRAPGFELQRNVIIQGEVKYPGTYSLTNRNERILSLIERAGGISESGFEEGATLRRSEDGLGYILLNLNEAMESPNSKFNYVLKDGDVIKIPKVKDLVTIKGAIKYPGIDSLRKVNVPYHKSKKAKFYVNNYGAGIDRKNRGRKKLIYVELPNGHVKKTKTIFFVKRSPKVQKGSTVTVGKKKKRKERVKTEKKEVDWGDVLTTTITQVTAVLTLIILFDRAF